MFPPCLAPDTWTRDVSMLVQAVPGRIPHVAYVARGVHSAGGLPVSPPLSVWTLRDYASAWKDRVLIVGDLRPSK